MAWRRWTVGPLMRAGVELNSVFLTRQLCEVIATSYISAEPQHEHARKKHGKQSALHHVLSYSNQTNACPTDLLLTTEEQSYRQLHHRVVSFQCIDRIIGSCLQDACCKMAVFHKLMAAL